jgi:hypothetical protein
MQTECSAKPSVFAPVEARPVVAEFDGGAVTSDAGGLLLGAADKAIGLVGRLAGCFRDARDGRYIEHTVATLVGQRVFGIALGYEDLNDHDDLRHDPVMSVLAGKLEAWRSDCAPVAGKSTLNRLELSRDTPTKYRKIAHEATAIEGLFVDLFLEAHAKAPKQITLDLDATDDPLHGDLGQMPSFALGGPVFPRLLRLLLLSAPLCVLRPTFAGSQAQTVKHRRECGREGGDRADRRTNPDALAARAHSASRRLRLLPRGADELV